MTTIRQFNRITMAMLAMTGRVTMLGISRWTGDGGDDGSDSAHPQYPSEERAVDSRSGTTESALGKVRDVERSVK